ncbi:LAMB1 [Branchiostoma lanceolatum]|uniref:LAMB1 protein n=1 Tax=Branchiostoma lanceolatum TaxID=7740 RepID=A0A8J9VSM8_BRALA|nr:LAMB1 [Branchiostoma lanceolatum]
MIRDTTSPFQKIKYKVVPKEGEESETLEESSGSSQVSSTTVTTTTRKLLGAEASAAFQTELVGLEEIDEVKKLVKSYLEKIEKLEDENASLRDTMGAAIAAQEGDEGGGRITSHYHALHCPNCGSSAEEHVSGSSQTLQLGSVQILTQTGIRSDEAIDTVTKVGHVFRSSTQTTSETSDKTQHMRGTDNVAATSVELAQQNLLQTVHSLEDENRLLKERLEALGERYTGPDSEEGEDSFVTIAVGQQALGEVDIHTLQTYSKEELLTKVTQLITENKTLKVKVEEVQILSPSRVHYADNTGGHRREFHGIEGDERVLEQLEPEARLALFQDGNASLTVQVERPKTLQSLSDDTMQSAIENTLVQGDSFTHAQYEQQVVDMRVQIERLKEENSTLVAQVQQSLDAESGAQKIQEEVAYLRSEIERLTKEKDNYAQQVERSREVIALGGDGALRELTEGISSLQTQLKEKTDELEYTEEILASKRAELDAVRQQKYKFEEEKTRLVGQASKSSEMSQEIETLKAQLEVSKKAEIMLVETLEQVGALQTENARLESEREVLTLKVDETARDFMKVQLLEQEVEKLNVDLKKQEETEKELKEVKESLDVARREKASLLEDQAAYNRHKEEVREAKEKIEVLQETLAVLAKQAKDTEMMERDLETALKEARENLSAVTSEKATLLQDAESRTKELEAAEEKIQTLQGQVHDLDAKSTTLTTTKEQFEYTKKELDALQAKNSELETQVAEITDLKKEITVARAVIQQLREGDDQAKSKHKEESAKLKKDLKISRENIDTLKTEKRAIEAKCMSSVQELEEVRVHIKTLEAEKQTLLTSEQKQKTKDLQDAHDRLEVLSEENKRLLKEQDNFQKQSEDLKAARKQIQSLQEKFTTQAELFEKIQGDLTKNVELVEDLQVENRKLQDQNKNLVVEKKKKHNERVVTLETEIVELTSRLERAEVVQRDLQAAEKELATFRTEKEQLVKEREVYQIQLAQKEEEVANTALLETEVSTLKEKMRDLKRSEQQLTELQGSFSAMKQEYEDRDKALEALRKEKEAFDNQLSEMEGLKKEIAIARNVIQELRESQEKTSEHKQKSKELTNVLERTRKEVNILQEEKEEMSKCFAASQKDLEDARTQIEQLQDEKQSLTSTSQDATELRTQLEEAKMSITTELQNFFTVQAELQGAMERIQTLEEEKKLLEEEVKEVSILERELLVVREEARQHQIEKSSTTEKVEAKEIQTDSGVAKKRAAKLKQEREVAVEQKRQSEYLRKDLEAAKQEIRRLKEERDNNDDANIHRSITSTRTSTSVVITTGESVETELSKAIERIEALEQEKRHLKEQIRKAHQNETDISGATDDVEIQESKRVATEKYETKVTHTTLKDNRSHATELQMDGESAHEQTHQMEQPKKELQAEKQVDSIKYTDVEASISPGIAPTILITTEVNDNQTEVEELRARIQVLEKEKMLLQEKVRTQKMDISAGGQESQRHGADSTSSERVEAKEIQTDAGVARKRAAKLKREKEVSQKEVGQEIMSDETKRGSKVSQKVWKRSSSDNDNDDDNGVDDGYIERFVSVMGASTSEEPQRHGQDSSPPEKVAAKEIQTEPGVARKRAAKLKREKGTAGQKVRSEETRKESKVSKNEIRSSTEDEEDAAGDDGNIERFVSTRSVLSSEERQRHGSDSSAPEGVEAKEIQTEPGVARKRAAKLRREKGASGHNIRSEETRKESKVSNKESSTEDEDDDDASDEDSNIERFVSTRNVSSSENTGNAKDIQTEPGVAKRRASKLKKDKEMMSEDSKKTKSLKAELQAARKEISRLQEMHDKMVIDLQEANELRLHLQYDEMRIKLQEKTERKEEILTEKSVVVTKGATQLEEDKGYMETRTRKVETKDDGMDESKRHLQAETIDERRAQSSSSQDEKGFAKQGNLTQEASEVGRYELRVVDKTYLSTLSDADKVTVLMEQLHNASVARRQLEEEKEQLSMEATNIVALQQQLYMVQTEADQLRRDKEDTIKHTDIEMGIEADHIYDTIIEGEEDLNDELKKVTSQLLQYETLDRQLAEARDTVDTLLSIKTSLEERATLLEKQAQGNEDMLRELAKQNTEMRDELMSVEFLKREVRELLFGDGSPSVGGSLSPMLSPSSRRLLEVGGASSTRFDFSTETGYKGSTMRQKVGGTSDTEEVASTDNYTTAEDSARSTSDSERDLRGWTPIQSSGTDEPKSNNKISRSVVTRKDIGVESDDSQDSIEVLDGSLAGSNDTKETAGSSSGAISSTVVQVTHFGHKSDTTDGEITPTVGEHFASRKRLTYQSDDKGMSVEDSKEKRRNLGSRGTEVGHEGSQDPESMFDTQTNSVRHDSQEKASSSVGQPSNKSEGVSATYDNKDARIAQEDITSSSHDTEKVTIQGNTIFTQGKKINQESQDASIGGQGQKESQSKDVPVSRRSDGASASGDMSITRDMKGAKKASSEKSGVSWFQKNVGSLFGPKPSAKQETDGSQSGNDVKDAGSFEHGETAKTGTPAVTSEDNDVSTFLSQAASTADKGTTLSETSLEVSETDIDTLIKQQLGIAAVTEKTKHVIKSTQYVKVLIEKLQIIQIHIWQNLSKGDSLDNDNSDADSTIQQMTEEMKENLEEMTTVLADLNLSVSHESSNDEEGETEGRDFSKDEKEDLIANLQQLSASSRDLKGIQEEMATLCSNYSDDSSKSKICSIIERLKIKLDTAVNTVTTMQQTEMLVLKYKKQATEKEETPDQKSPGKEEKSKGFFDKIRDWWRDSSDPSEEPVLLSQKDEEGKMDTYDKSDEEERETTDDPAEANEDQGDITAFHNVTLGGQLQVESMKTESVIDPQVRTTEGKTAMNAPDSRVKEHGSIEGFISVDTRSKSTITSHEVISSVQAEKESNEAKMETKILGQDEEDGLSEGTDSIEIKRKDTTASQVVNPSGQPEMKATDAKTMITLQEQTKEGGLSEEVVSIEAEGKGPTASDMVDPSGQAENELPEAKTETTSQPPPWQDGEEVALNEAKGKDTIASDALTPDDKTAMTIQQQAEGDSEEVVSIEAKWKGTTTSDVLTPSGQVQKELPDDKTAITIQQQAEGVALMEAKWKGNTTNSDSDESIKIEADISRDMEIMGVKVDTALKSVTLIEQQMADIRDEETSQKRKQKAGSESPPEEARSGSFFGGLSSWWHRGPVKESSIPKPLVPEDEADDDEFVSQNDRDETVEDADVPDLSDEAKETIANMQIMWIYMEELQNVYRDILEVNNEGASGGTDRDKSKKVQEKTIEMDRKLDSMASLVSSTTEVSAIEREHFLALMAKFQKMNKNLAGLQTKREADAERGKDTAYVDAKIQRKTERMGNRLSRMAKIVKKMEAQTISQLAAETDSGFFGQFFASKRTQQISDEPDDLQEATSEETTDVDEEDTTDNVATIKPEVSPETTAFIANMQIITSRIQEMEIICKDTIDDYSSQEAEDKAGDSKMNSMVEEGMNSIQEKVDSTLSLLEEVETGTPTGPVQGNQQDRNKEEQEKSVIMVSTALKEIRVLCCETMDFVKVPSQDDGQHKDVAATREMVQQNMSKIQTKLETLPEIIAISTNIATEERASSITSLDIGDDSQLKTTLPPRMNNQVTSTEDLNINVQKAMTCITELDELQKTIRELYAERFREDIDDTRSEEVDQILQREMKNVGSQIHVIWNLILEKQTVDQSTEETLADEDDTTPPLLTDAGWEKLSQVSDTLLELKARQETLPKVYQKRVREGQRGDKGVLSCVFLDTQMEKEMEGAKANTGSAIQQLSEVLEELSAARHDDTTDTPSKAEVQRPGIIDHLFWWRRKEKDDEDDTAMPEETMILIANMQILWVYVTEMKETQTCLHDAYSDRFGDGITEEQCKEVDKTIQEHRENMDTKVESVLSVVQEIQGSFDVEQDEAQQARANSKLQKVVYLIQEVRDTNIKVSEMYQKQASEEGDEKEEDSKAFMDIRMQEELQNVSRKLSKTERLVTAAEGLALGHKVADKTESAEEDTLDSATDSIKKEEQPKGWFGGWWSSQETTEPSLTTQASVKAPSEVHEEDDEDRVGEKVPQSTGAFRRLFRWWSGGYSPDHVTFPEREDLENLATRQPDVEATDAQTETTAEELTVPDETDSRDDETIDISTGIIHIEDESHLETTLPVRINNQVASTKELTINVQKAMTCITELDELQKTIGELYAERFREDIDDTRSEEVDQILQREMKNMGSQIQVIWNLIPEKQTVDQSTEDADEDSTTPLLLTDAGWEKLSQVTGTLLELKARQETSLKVYQKRVREGQRGDKGAASCVLLDTRMDKEMEGAKANTGSAIQQLSEVLEELDAARHADITDTPPKAEVQVQQPGIMDRLFWWRRKEEDDEDDTAMPEETMTLIANMQILWVYITEMKETQTCLHDAYSDRFGDGITEGQCKDVDKTIQDHRESMDVKAERALSVVQEIQESFDVEQDDTQQVRANSKLQKVVSLVQEVRDTNIQVSEMYQKQASEEGDGKDEDSKALIDVKMQEELQNVSLKLTRTERLVTAAEGLALGHKLADKTESAEEDTLDSVADSVKEDQPKSWFRRWWSSPETTEPSTKASAEAPSDVNEKDDEDRVGENVPQSTGAFRRLFRCWSGGNNQDLVTSPEKEEQENLATRQPEVEATDAQTRAETTAEELTVADETDSTEDETLDISTDITDIGDESHLKTTLPVRINNQVACTEELTINVQKAMTYITELDELQKTIGELYAERFREDIDDTQSEEVDQILQREMKNVGSQIHVIWNLIPDRPNEAQSTEETNEDSITPLLLTDAGWEKLSQVSGTLLELKARQEASLKLYQKRVREGQRGDKGAASCVLLDTRMEKEMEEAKASTGSAIQQLSEVLEELKVAQHDDTTDTPFEAEVQHPGIIDRLFWWRRKEEDDEDDTAMPEETMTLIANMQILWVYITEMKETQTCLHDAYSDRFGDGITEEQCKEVDKTIQDHRDSMDAAAERVLSVVHEIQESFDVEQDDAQQVRANSKLQKVVSLIQEVRDTNIQVSEMYQKQASGDEGDGKDEDSKALIDVRMQEELQNVSRKLRKTERLVTAAEALALGHKLADETESAEEDTLDSVTDSITPEAKKEESKSWFRRWWSSQGTTKTGTQASVEAPSEVKEEDDVNRLADDEDRASEKVPQTTGPFKRLFHWWSSGYNPDHVTFPEREDLENLATSHPEVEGKDEQAIADTFKANTKAAMSVVLGLKEICAKYQGQAIATKEDEGPDQMENMMLEDESMQQNIAVIGHKITDLTEHVNKMTVVTQYETIRKDKEDTELKDDEEVEKGDTDNDEESQTFIAAFDKLLVQMQELKSCEMELLTLTSAEKSAGEEHGDHELTTRISQVMKELNTKICDVGETLADIEPKALAHCESIKTAKQSVVDESVATAPYKESRGILSRLYGWGPVSVLWWRRQEEEGDDAAMPEERKILIANMQTLWVHITEMKETQACLHDAYSDRFGDGITDEQGKDVDKTIQIHKENMDTKVEGVLSVVQEIQENLNVEQAGCADAGLQARTNSKLQKVVSLIQEVRDTNIRVSEMYQKQVGGEEEDGEEGSITAFTDARMQQELQNMSTNICQAERLVTSAEGLMLGQKLADATDDEALDSATDITTSESKKEDVQPKSWFRGWWSNQVTKPKTQASVEEPTEVKDDPDIDRKAEVEDKAAEKESQRAGLFRRLFRWYSSGYNPDHVTFPDGDDLENIAPCSTEEDANDMQTTVKAIKVSAKSATSVILEMKKMCAGFQGPSIAAAEDEGSALTEEVVLDDESMQQNTAVIGQKITNLTEHCESVRTLKPGVVDEIDATAPQKEGRGFLNRLFGWTQRTTEDPPEQLDDISNASEETADIDDMERDPVADVQRALVCCQEIYEARSKVVENYQERFREDTTELRTQETGQIICRELRTIESKTTELAECLYKKTTVDTGTVEEEHQAIQGSPIAGSTSEQDKLLLEVLTHCEDMKEIQVKITELYDQRLRESTVGDERSEACVYLDTRIEKELGSIQSNTTEITDKLTALLQDLTGREYAKTEVEKSQENEETSGIFGRLIWWRKTADEKDKKPTETSIPNGTGTLIANMQMMFAYVEEMKQTQTCFEDAYSDRLGDGITEEQIEGVEKVIRTQMEHMEKMNEKVLVLLEEIQQIEDAGIEQQADVNLRLQDVAAIMTECKEVRCRVDKLYHLRLSSDGETDQEGTMDTTAISADVQIRQEMNNITEKLDKAGQLLLRAEALTQGCKVQEPKDTNIEDSQKPVEDEQTPKVSSWWWTSDATDAKESIAQSTESTPLLEEQDERQRSSLSKGKERTGMLRRLFRWYSKGYDPDHVTFPNKEELTKMESTFSGKDDSQEMVQKVLDATDTQVPGSSDEATPDKDNVVNKDNLSGDELKAKSDQQEVPEPSEHRGFWGRLFQWWGTERKLAPPDESEGADIRLTQEVESNIEVIKIYLSELKNICGCLQERFTIMEAPSVDGDAGVDAEDREKIDEATQQLIANRLEEIAMLVNNIGAVIPSDENVSADQEDSETIKVQKNLQTIRVNLEDTNALFTEIQRMQEQSDSFTSGNAAKELQNMEAKLTKVADMVVNIEPEVMKYCEEPSTGFQQEEEECIASTEGKHEVTQSAGVLTRIFKHWWETSHSAQTTSDETEEEETDGDEEDTRERIKAAASDQMRAFLTNLEITWVHILELKRIQIDMEDSHKLRGQDTEDISQTCSNVQQELVKMGEKLVTVHQLISDLQNSIPEEMMAAETEEGAVEGSQSLHAKVSEQLKRISSIVVTLQTDQFNVSNKYSVSSYMEDDASVKQFDAMFNEEMEGIRMKLEEVTELFTDVEDIVMKEMKTKHKKEEAKSSKSKKATSTTQKKSIQVQRESIFSRLFHWRMGSVREETEYKSDEQFSADSADVEKTTTETETGVTPKRHGLVQRFYGWFTRRSTSDETDATQETLEEMPAAETSSTAETSVEGSRTQMRRETKNRQAGFFRTISSWWSNSVKIDIVNEEGKEEPTMPLGLQDFIASVQLADVYCNQAQSSLAEMVDIYHQVPTEEAGALGDEKKREDMKNRLCVIESTWKMLLSTTAKLESALAKDGEGWEEHPGITGERVMDDVTREQTSLLSHDLKEMIQATLQMLPRIKRESAGEELGDHEQGKTTNITVQNMQDMYSTLDKMRIKLHKVEQLTLLGRFLHREDQMSEVKSKYGKEVKEEGGWFRWWGGTRKETTSSIAQTAEAEMRSGPDDLQTQQDVAVEETDGQRKDAKTSVFGRVQRWWSGVYQPNYDQYWDSIDEPGSNAQHTKREDLNAETTSTVENSGSMDDMGILLHDAEDQTIMTRGLRLELDEQLDKLNERSVDQGIRKGILGLLVVASIWFVGGVMYVNTNHGF